MMKNLHYPKDLNYGNNGIFLFMGAAVLISSTVCLRNYKVLDWFTGVRKGSMRSSHVLRLLCKAPLHGGSWLVITRVISKITLLITHIRGLLTPLITTHEP